MSQLQAVALNEGPRCKMSPCAASGSCKLPTCSLLVNRQAEPLLATGPLRAADARAEIVLGGRSSSIIKATEIQSYVVIVRRVARWGAICVVNGSELDNA